MKRSLIRNRSITVTLMLGLFSCLTVATLVLYPAEAFEASLGGLQFWWNVVFPALLPYLILVRLASVYGLFRILGRLLEPLARWLRLPPGSGIPLSAGLFLGYAGEIACAPHASRGSRAPRGGEPAGISPEDGASAVAACSLANPVLVLTVLATSLLASPGIGLFLLAVHYAGWLLTALTLFRFRRTGSGDRPGTGFAKADVPDPFHPADAGPANPASADAGSGSGKPRSFGHILGDSVTESLQKLLELGGIIIVFAVAVRMIRISGLPGLAADLLALAGWPGAGEWVMPVLAGWLEIHNGIRDLAHAATHPQPALSLLGATLAWGGLAVHLDVRARLRKAGFRYGPFLRFRLVHALLAGTLTAVLWPVVRQRFAPWPVRPEHAAASADWPSLWSEPVGMPGAAFYAAALITLLLIQRLTSRSR